MVKALQNGPWFIFGYFLSVQRWEPNFVASEAKQMHTAVWIILPQLQQNYTIYGIILQKIGNMVGRLLKIDACTSATLRGCYARLCVELPLDQPDILIGSHRQQILYELKEKVFFANLVVGWVTQFVKLRKDNGNGRSTLSFFKRRSGKSNS